MDTATTTAIGRRLGRLQLEVLAATAAPGGFAPAGWAIVAPATDARILARLEVLGLVTAARHDGDYGPVWVWTATDAGRDAFTAAIRHADTPVGA